MLAFTSISLYTLIWLLSYAIICYSYKRRRRAAGTKEIAGHERLRGNITIAAIICVSLLFALYNYYATTNALEMGGDRQNYTINFLGIRNTPSAGLAFLIQAIRALGGDVTWLFYFTTFSCLFITLYAYRIAEDATPRAMLLFFLSQGVTSTLVNQKQAYTSAFAVLCIVLLLRNRGRKDNVFCFIAMLLAIVFHPTGFILLPIYFIVKVPKNRKTMLLLFAAILILVIFFKPILALVGTKVVNIAPRLSAKIFEYIGRMSGEGSGLEESSALAVLLKGIPYYFIAFLGIVKRKSLVSKIENYDNYLVISVAAACLYFLGIYNVWFTRFIYLFIIPVFTFFNLMMQHTYLPFNRWAEKFLVYGSIAVTTYRYLYLIWVQGGF